VLKETVRKMGSTKFITIPAQISKALGWDFGDKLEVKIVNLEGNMGLFITKAIKESHENESKEKEGGDSGHGVA